MSVNSQFADDFEMLFGIKVPILHPNRPELMFWPMIHYNKCFLYWATPDSNVRDRRCSTKYDQWSLFYRLFNLKPERCAALRTIDPRREFYLHDQLYEMAKHEIHLASILRLFMIED